MTTRTPEEVARAVADVTGWNPDVTASEREWTATGMGPVGQHRDSDALDRSNFTVIYQDLSERFGDSVDIARFGHWACGWVEEIIFDIGNDDCEQAVAAWRAKLDDYPVADEAHWSELEWDEMSDYLGDEVPAVLRTLDILPLTADGMDELIYRVHSNGDYSENNVGDISEHVLDEYCAILAEVNIPGTDQLIL